MSFPNLEPKKARKIRVLLNTLILLSVCYVSIPMIIGAIKAIQNHKVIDPFTGKLLSKDTPAGSNNNCPQLN